MENEVTITIDPTNAISAMAFVVADQQRMIKELQCELARMDASRRNAEDTLCERAKVYGLEIAERDEKIRDLQAVIDRQDAEADRKKDKICELEEDNKAMSFRLEEMPDWRTCKVEYDKDGKRWLTGFEQDGPTILSFYINDGSDGFWDFFGKQRKAGDVAYMGVHVSDGVCGENLYSVAIDKEIKYLALHNFIGYQDIHDADND